MGEGGVLHIVGELVGLNDGRCVEVLHLVDKQAGLCVGGGGCGVLYLVGTKQARLRAGVGSVGVLHLVCEQAGLRDGGGRDGVLRQVSE